MTSSSLRRFARARLVHPAHGAALALALAICALAPTARAHTVLVNPGPLIGNDDAKAAPCGCTFGAGGIACPPDYPIAEFEAGQQITVSWNETIQHTGNFRVAFSSKPPEEVTAADFDDAALQVTVDDDMAGGLFTQSFTLPDEPCELCTLQVRQFMEDAAEPYYFTCAAMRIVDGGGAGGGGPSGTTTSAGAGGGGSGDGGGSDGSGNPGDDDGGDGEPQWQPEPAEGCTATPGREVTSTGWIAVGIAAAVAVSRRRKRRRTD